MMHKPSKSYLNYYYLTEVRGREKRKKESAPRKEDRNTLYFAEEPGWSHGKTTLMQYCVFAKHYSCRGDRANLQKFSWGNV